MSSLAATQADGYNIPPEYLESGKYKTQSINQFNKSKGHNQYLERGVVRFELPFDGFCTVCESHVGKGTRFNAKKSHVGDYFTTKIWEFETKCRICAKVKFCIRTNPQKRTFDYVSGIRKKEEEFDTIDAGTLGMIDTDSGETGIHHSTPGSNSSPSRNRGDHDVNNPIGRLEKEARGKRQAMTERDRLEALMVIQGNTTRDDATSNSNLRATFRSSRNAKKRRIEEAVARGLGRGIEMGEASETDISASKAVFRGSEARHEKVRKKEKKAFLALRSTSIFDQKKEKHRKAASKNSRGHSRRNADSGSMMGRSRLRVDEVESASVHIGSMGIRIKRESNCDPPVCNDVVRPKSPQKEDKCGGDKTEAVVNSELRNTMDSSLAAIGEYSSDSD